MATIPELQSQIATYTAELGPLQAAADAAKVLSNQATAAVNAAPNRPNLVTLSNARQAAAADPANTQLQQTYAGIQSQWDAKQAVYLPLLAASDQAAKVFYTANGLIVDKENQITDAEVAVAQIDPSQAAPGILQHMKDFGILPLAPNSDPALPQPLEVVVTPVSGSTPTADPVTDPETEAARFARQSEQAIVYAAPPYISAAQDSAAASATIAAAEPISNTAEEARLSRGLSASKLNTQSQATQQDLSNFQQQADWRVRLRLAPGATYLYKDPDIYTTQSILIPLLGTDGVIFPYTPAISVTYAASYSPTDVTHSNYTFFSYQNSKVESISIGCDFTAQDTAEANYLLAVIHFFKSATKMFYGQDQNPRNGTPPPLCYLSGLGAFQFDEHPLAITGFNYTLPTDVDYIRAGNPSAPAGVNLYPITTKQNAASVSGFRAANNGLVTGGGTAPPKFSINYSTKEPTYVPTKISLSITAFPIVTRNEISNNFSLKKYATGELLRGSKRAGGGIW